MTDSVPIRAYVNALAIAITLGFAAVIVVLDAKNEKATALALDGQKEATNVALKAADEKGVAHNGLIDRMREMSSSYITRGNIYSALIAAGVVSGIYFEIARAAH